MNIVADMHTHTIASGHAYSTLNELAAEAARKGLLAMAVTDHGPALPGGPHMYHFGAMRFFPETICGVRILRGIEANIIDARGTLDLPEHYLKKLDFVMAGLHEGCGFDGAEAATYTDAVINAMENPLVKAISHPGNPIFPLDYEAVVAAARRTGTALEMNNTSFSISRKGSRPNCERLARADRPPRRAGGHRQRRPHRPDGRRLRRCRGGGRGSGDPRGAGDELLPGGAAPVPRPRCVTSEPLESFHHEDTKVTKKSTM